jgi:hypothetical protein
MIIGPKEGVRTVVVVPGSISDIRFYVLHPGLSVRRHTAWPGAGGVHTDCPAASLYPGGAGPEEGGGPGGGAYEDGGGPGGGL